MRTRTHDGRVLRLLVLIGRGKQRAQQADQPRHHGVANGRETVHGGVVGVWRCAHQLQQHRQRLAGAAGRGVAQGVA
jgi:hypothetical protein